MEKGEQMICLGLESTSHTFGAGITNGKKELANEKIMYRTRGGIHPRQASHFLAKHAHEVLGNAFSKSHINWDSIDVIAFSRGPGLGPCLEVGTSIAKSLAFYHKKALLSVNHCVAHIEIGKWDCKCNDPLVIYVSGANTQILGLKGNRYRIYGETLDMGLGNALDVFGRELGLEFPCGPKIEELALHAKNFIELPYTVKGMDLAFSGLLTAAKKSIGKTELADLCFSFQETIFGMLVEVSERALAHTEKKELMLVGGVAQNKRLCSMLRDMSSIHNSKFFVPKPEYNADNGMMIALTGLKMYKAGIRENPEELFSNQKWRTDEVEVI